jgi:cytochrome c oxidase subunit 2
MDVIPGRYTTTWFEATTPGRYYLFCTEYCGTNHSGMGGWVEVMRETDYQAWLSGSNNEQSPVAAGEELFTNLGCVSCHRADGAGGRGPALQNLFGSQVDLQNGSQVTADETYIRESILNPTARIVRGYPAIMPTFQGQVSEEQLLQLVVYVRSLSPAGSNGIETTAPARSNNPSTGAPTVGGQGAETPDALRSNPLSPTAPQQRGGGGSGMGQPGGLTGNTSSQSSQPPRSNTQTSTGPGNSNSNRR